jgi:hypothetical protein
LPFWVLLYHFVFNHVKRNKEEKHQGSRRG